MMNITLYNIYSQEKIATINVKSSYESSFYFRNMPTIGGRTCAKILNAMYPHFKADGVEVLAVDNKTQNKGIIKLYRNGTIVNF